MTKYLLLLAIIVVAILFKLGYFHIGKSKPTLANPTPALVKATPSPIPPKSPSSPIATEAKPSSKNVKSAPLPKIAKFQIPAGIYYLTKRVSFITDSGIRGCEKGTKVTLIKKNAATWRVKDKDGAFEISPNKLSNDPEKVTRLLAILSAPKPTPPPPSPEAIQTAAAARARTKIRYERSQQSAEMGIKIKAASQRINQNNSAISQLNAKIPNLRVQEQHYYGTRNARGSYVGTIGRSGPRPNDVIDQIENQVNGLKKQNYQLQNQIRDWHRQISALQAQH